MPLSAQEQQELSELEEMDKLESQVGAQVPRETASRPGPNQPGYISGLLNSPEAKQNIETMVGAGMGSAGPMKLVSGAEQASKPLLSKLADFLQQKAVGMKKFVPGVGEKLMQEGVYGTKGMMQKQIVQGLKSRGQELGDVVSKIKGNVSAKSLAEVFDNEAKSFATPGGITTPEASKMAEMAKQRAQEILSRGDLPAKEAQAVKLLVQRTEGYKGGEPLQKYSSKLAQKETSGLGDALEKLAGGTEQQPSAYANTNESFSALARGNKAINQPTKISQGNSVLNLISKVAAPLQATIGSPLALSTGARAAQGAGKLQQLLKDPTKRALLSALAKQQASQQIDENEGGAQ